MFGSNGGKLDGLQPGDPEIAKAGLIGGDVVVTFHNDVKVGHLRNLYEKFGPTYGTAIAEIPAGHAFLSSQGALRTRTRDGSTCGRVAARRCSSILPARTGSMARYLTAPRR